MMHRGLLVIPVALVLSTAGCSSAPSTSAPNGSSASAPPASTAMPASPEGSTSSALPSSPAGEPTTVRLLTHDSFALSKELVTAFEERTGITLNVVMAGDAGELVNKAVLASGQPDGDVLFGVDNVLLTRALTAGVFEPYTSPAQDDLRPELVALGQGVVTPVDDGDVCVNIDDAWFAARDLSVPRSLDDLLQPEYKDLLVVENPATSSPGLAFLLATIARYGDQWPDYWKRLKDNGVKVVNGWSEAYLSTFTAGGEKGDRPLVVSYSTSPPAEIVYAADPKPASPSTSSMTDGCYHQVEFAGVLAGAANPEAARAVVDWLVSPEVQADIPLSMFVFPARTGTPLPDVFADFVTRPADPLEIDAAVVDAQRDDWIDQWTELVLR